MGHLIQGVHPQLEEIADSFIKESLRGVTSRSEKSDILTEWKEKHRKSVEVYSYKGIVDASVHQGLFKRARNTAKPYLNSTDGKLTAGRIRTSSNYLENGDGVHDKW